MSSSCSPDFAPGSSRPSIPHLQASTILPLIHPSVHPTIVRPSVQQSPPPGFLLHLSDPTPELEASQAYPQAWFWFSPQLPKAPRPAGPPPPPGQRKSRKIDVISVGLTLLQAVNLARPRRTCAASAGYRRAPRGTWPRGVRYLHLHDVRSRPRAHRHLHHLLPPPCHRPAVNRAPPCATRRCRGWLSEK